MIAYEGVVGLGNEWYAEIGQKMIPPLVLETVKPFFY